jgi:hypothetical protein
MGGIILGAILIPLRSPIAQDIAPPPAISLDFRCPSYPVSGAQPLTLVADILGTEDREVVRPLVFRWSISNGKIERGQGTPEIHIASLPASRIGLQVKVIVDGGPPELGNEKSCVLTVDPMCFLAPKIDQYSDILIEAERQHLDRFAERLKAYPSESIGYIFSYAGKNACIYEATWRGKRALQYLVERHNIPTNRLVMVDGGFRDEWTVDLFIQPNALCGPLPTPTRKRVQVHVSGRCGR